MDEFITDLSSPFITVHRVLDEATGGGDDDDAADQNQSQVLRDTFVVYGSLLVVLFLLFCWVRLKFPKAYTLRNWVDGIKTPLAESQYGFFSWIWRQQMATEDELMNECGMDALCFLRVLRMGYKISFLGCFNAIWLMPLYNSADSADDTSSITDNIIEVTIAHVPAESKLLISTTIAAYLIFGYTLYLIYKEFDWFLEQRQKYLKRPLARNYAVYVQGLPSQYRTNASLDYFFGECFSHDKVVEASVRVNTPNLAKLVASRDGVVAKLEHAIAFEEIKGVAPTHSKNMVSLTGGGDQVDSIQEYTEDLKDLNEEIRDAIAAIERKQLADAESSNVVASGVNASNVNTMYGIPSAESSLTHPEENASLMTKTDPLSMEPEPDVKFDESVVKFDESVVAPVDAVEKSKGGSFKNPLGAGVSALKKSAAVAASLLKKEEDGKMYGAGFVVFNKLSTVQAALQMVHAGPFIMETFGAPDPEDIIWTNVGKEHKELQLGKLSSFLITATICLLWTIPMAFFASLSSVEGLKKQFSWIADAIEAYPFLEPLLEQLAPLLVVLANSMLPIILEIVSGLERPISNAILESLMFSKLAVFMIIQTFFVSAISGSITEEIDGIINDPTSIIDLLAQSLPSQSTYFIQIVFVGTTIMVGIESLRVVPLALAAIRRCVGPRLTEKERNTTFVGIRPLSDPIEFEHADTFSQLVLYFVVLLVYSVIAPITNFVMGFVFIFMGIAYRHQFIYIYPPQPDSGGKLWISFMNILIVIIFIAQFTIIGLLALKKAGVASILMIPLLIITILFNTYIKQQHFRVTEFLTSRECLKMDVKNGDLDLSFVKGTFIQPELKATDEFPENGSESQLRALDLTEQPGSDVEEPSGRDSSEAMSEQSDPVRSSTGLRHSLGF